MLHGQRQRRQSALVISVKPWGKAHVCTSASILNEDTGSNSKVWVSLEQGPSSFTQASTHPVKTNIELPHFRRQQEELSSHNGLVKESAQATKIGVSFLSLRVWICSSPFPAGIGSLYEPQAFSIENQTFKMVGKASVQMPTWISVPRKTRELASNN